MCLKKKPQYWLYLVIIVATFLNLPNYLISNQGGMGMSLFIMGLTTQDQHSQKEHIEITKIIKFCVYRTQIEQGTAI